MGSSILRNPRMSYFITNHQFHSQVHIDSARFGVVMELALDSLKVGRARTGSSRWLGPWWRSNAS